MVSKDRREPRVKPLKAEEKTSNKLNPHMVSIPNHSTSGHIGGRLVPILVLPQANLMS